MSSWPGSRRRRNYEAYPTVKICSTIYAGRCRDVGSKMGTTYDCRNVGSVFRVVARPLGRYGYRICPIAILVSVAAIAGMGSDRHLAQQHLHRLCQQSLKELANGGGCRDGRIFPGSRPTAYVSMAPHRGGQDARAS